MSEYRTTVTIDLTDCNGCNKADEACEKCDLYDVECEVVCDVEPYRPAKLNAPAEDCYPAEGGVSIEDIIRTDTKQSVFSHDLVDKIIDKVAESYAEHIADRGD